MSGFVSSAEGELNSIVKEYLRYLGFNHLSKSFEEECQKSNRPIQESSYGSYRDERVAKIENELSRLFGEGNHTQFFSLWSSCVSADVRERDAPCQKLEFQLHVYFAVYHLRNPERVGKEDIESAMFQFRQYLESRGAVLGDTKEFLLYCALPYLPNPREHPSFKEIFEESWVEDLRNRVETFVWETLRETSKNPQQPRLLNLYYCNDMELNDMRREYQYLERRYGDTEKQCIVQLKQVTKLQEDYKRLTNVTAELITALEGIIRGDTVDIDQVLSSCDRQFPEMFQIQRSHSSHLSRDESLSGAEKLQSTLSRQCSLEKDHLVHKLNFTKIRQDLAFGDITQKCFLLQALRWMLTKPSNFNQRDAVAMSYVNNDLLGLGLRQSEYSNRILHTVRSANGDLQQTFSRFLNAFSSFSKGRAYLARSSQLVAVLTNCLLMEQHLNVASHDMILGTLQKLSLRRPLQEFMINEGVLEWIVKRLDDKDNLTDYSLEYAIALLMNLCLQSSGKKRCMEMVHPTLHTLKKLLTVENKEILPYVNGALYSLLSKEEIKKIALEMGIEADLQRVMKTSLDEIRRQLEIVYGKLIASDDTGVVTSSLNSVGGDYEQEHEEDEEEDDDDEGSEIEPEIDLEDPVVPLSNQLHGERLLKLCYTEEDLPQTAVHREGGEPRPDCSLLPHTGTSGRAECASEGSHSGHETLDVDADEQSAPCFPLVPQVNEEFADATKTVNVEDAAAAMVAIPLGDKTKGLNVGEYSMAFSSRPKIPRTPESSAACTEGHHSGRRIRRGTMDMAIKAGSSFAFPQTSKSGGSSRTTV